jgi:hypothetical protein
VDTGRRLLMRHPRLGLLALALVLGLRVLIPPGMMPVADTARGLVVALCDGSGPATLHTLILQPGGLPAKGKGEQDDKTGPCAFGVLADAMLGGGESAALPLPGILPAPLPPRPALAWLLDRPAHSRPPARAPPPC